MSNPESIKKEMKFDSQEQELYLNLWRTYDRLKKLEDELFEKFEITSQQYNVLRLLKASGSNPVPTFTIAQRLVSRAPDMTRMIDKLVESGWVERLKSDENRRLVLLQITSEGLRLLKSIAKPLNDCHQMQLGHLSQAQMTQLSKLLKIAREPHEDEDSPWRD